MQALEVLSSISVQIGCGICVFFTLGFLFVKLVALLIGSHIIGILIIVFGVYKLLRAVGTFLLYPGCFNYVKSDIQLRGSQRMAQQIFKCMQQLFGLLHRCEHQPDNSYLSPTHTVDHVSQIITLLAKFQPTLSQNKKALLHIYRQIRQFLKTQYKASDMEISIQNFISNPGIFRQQIQQKFGNTNQLRNIAKHIKQRISILYTQLQPIVRSYQPPAHQGLVKNIMYRMYAQKLYEIRFGYIYWDAKFQYTIHQVESKKSDAVIQCAVIKCQKNKTQQNSKAVIICCPNGAFLQYFALENLGYQIVLWNYRGYGQSTGSPSISDSISDAQAVYNYCKRVLNIDVEIVHGYSIGGPPATSLALTHPVKILVVDRSFCNFVNIAQEMSPILAKLAKIVMRSDSNIKISDYYLRIKGCKKIMIWSPVDEVISHGSSLKLGVLKNLYLRNEGQADSQQNSPNSTIFQEQLAQINSNNWDTKSSNKLQIEPLKNMKTWVQKFIYFFDVLSSKSPQKFDETKSQNNKDSVVTQQNENNSLIQDLHVAESPKKSQQNSLKKAKQHQIFQQFWQIVRNIDGAGTSIMFLKQLTEGGNQKSLQLHLQVKSFVLGLVYYGCCFKENGKLEQDNINNIPHTIENLTIAQQKLTLLLQENKQSCTIQFLEYLRLFKNLLTQIRIYIQKSNKNIRKQIGVILPTNSGHNGQLTQQQISYLKAAILSTEETMLHQ